jgi:hypothetical protein
MSAAKSLLHRQVKLLEYLTSGDAIFQDKRNTPLDSVLQGIDRWRLDVEARFSHEKRMEKVYAVFPKTCELLGTARETLVRAFTDTCPPLDISRLANARQFHDFLSARWRREAPDPPYLPDVAAYELTCAIARVFEGLAAGVVETAQPPGHLRRRQGVQLLRTACDIRAMFEDAAAEAPVERATTLAIVGSPLGNQPRIFELPPAVFDLLDVLGAWTDRAAFSGSPEADELIADLATAGLLEVSG